MDLLRVAGATVNQIPLDFAGNRERLRRLIEEAKAQGVELLCLPELALTGYGCEDAFFSLSTAKMAESSLDQLLPYTDGITVVIGLPHYYYGAMYNCAAVVQDGRILGVNAKRVLPREGVHYEPRWFRPWPFGKVAQTILCGERVPLGDVRYRLGQVGVAIEICEEAWDSVPASAAHADAVDLILNPSASHFALGKYAKREHLVANSSRSMQVIYVYTNLLGNEAGRMIYDGGVLFAEGGEVVARGRRFGFGDGEVVYRDVNPELASLSKLKVKPVREGGDSAPSHQELRQVEIQGRDPRAKPHLGVKTTPKRASGGSPQTYVPLTRDEEFLQAEMLGLFDYLRKSKAKGYVVPLSGGCDSACCAVLIGHMIAAARAELGVAGFAKRLGLGKLDAGDPKTAVKEILTCLYLPTKNSGAKTREAASDVAQAIGASFQILDVDSEVNAYVAAAEKVLGRKLTWEQDDVTLQNVQARARAPLVWTVANARNALLVSTSNRSEAAVGYATMDGDTAGGLAPLSGIDKPFLRAWLKWAESQANAGLGALPGLAKVNALPPTAELRPPGQDQTDEADLMPYPVLERIERYLVRDRLGPDDILQTLAFDFPSTDPAVLRGYCDRFFQLWSRNQWKRERFAPGFHLDDESLDPKSWCRFPIFSMPYFTT